MSGETTTIYESIEQWKAQSELLSTQAKQYLAEINQQLIEGIPLPNKKDDIGGFNLYLVTPDDIDTIHGIVHLTQTVPGSDALLGVTPEYIQSLASKNLIYCIKDKDDKVVACAGAEYLDPTDVESRRNSNFPICEIRTSATGDAPKPKKNSEELNNYFETMNAISSSLQIGEAKSNDPRITLLSPNMGEGFVEGQTVNISWITTNIPDNYKIAVHIRRHKQIEIDGQEFDPLIFTDLKNDGNETWVIPTGMYPETSYDLEISTYDISAGKSYSDVTDKPFRIMK